MQMMYIIKVYINVVNILSTVHPKHTFWSISKIELQLFKLPYLIPKVTMYTNF